MDQPLVIRKMIDINPKDESLSRLMSAAGRISALLSKAKVKKDAVSCLDEFLGAVYALIFARLGGFADRPKGVPIQPGRIDDRANEIAAGKIRTDGTWMAGFHFNGALFRIAAMYHRSLKVVLGKPTSREYAPQLLPEAAKAYLTWTSKVWQSTSNEAVYSEVNHLKHSSDGLREGRAVKFSVAVEAIEELLTLIESWSTQP